jgi:uncharacterized membrane protein YphA (DoxX/SURF4 family)
MQAAQFIEASVRNAGALDTGLPIARLVFGLTLSAHGAQKLFGWFGLLGSVGPALMLSVMIVAAGAVHWTRGFFATTNGIEPPLLYATVAIALALTGPASSRSMPCSAWRHCGHRSSPPRR